MKRFDLIEDLTLSEQNKERLTYMYDIIGDIHGQASELEALLQKMDYSRVNGVYEHENRKVVFAGDFIDRGTEHIQALGICKTMVEQGSALAVMGNHEFNAICFATQHPEQPDTFLRKHSPDKIQAHQNFLNEYPLNSTGHREMVDWFRTLPLFLDLGDIRIVHAVWHHRSLAAVKNCIDENNCLLAEAYVSASDKTHPLYSAIEHLLKGVRFKLPEGYSFTDKGGKVRTAVRLKWWDEQADRLPEAATNTNGAILPELQLPEDRYRYHDTVPLFFGHYWMQGIPAVLSPKTACVDYSSEGSNSKLTAYRWQGESILTDKHFVWVNKII